MNHTKEKSKGAPRAVTKAKKMVLRKPNQKIMAKVEKLKSLRVKPTRLAAERLQKILAASGLGSRRKMEELIAAGKVTVNGKIAQLGDKAGPTDEVRIEGEKVRLLFPDRLPRIVLYYKEEGEIVSRDDPKGRLTVFERLPLAKNSQWRTIGRLDINTSGLLIFTTSGELIEHFTHPRYAVDRQYAARVDGMLTPEQLEELTTTGVELEDGIAKVTQITAREKAENTGGRNFWYDITIQEGKNHEIRRIFEHYGLMVNRLIRTRFGPIAIPPRLKHGHYYELNELEVEYVLKVMGLLERWKK